MPTKQTPAAPAAPRQSSSASVESLRAEVRTLGALPKPEMELRLRALDLPRLCDLARAADLPVCADRRRLEARCVHGFAKHSESVDLGAGAGPTPANPPQCLADRSFLAEGRRFLKATTAAAKSVGVPLDEFLIRVGFAAEQRRRPEDRWIFSASFIRAAISQDVWSGWRATDHLICPAVDLLACTDDGQPDRPFPAAFDLAPESKYKDAARWTPHSEFFVTFGLEEWPWEADVAWQFLEEHESGRYLVQLMGERPRGLCEVKWVSPAVACWYFGLSPDFIADCVKKGWLLTTIGKEPCVSLHAVSDLLGWLKQEDRNNPPRTVTLPLYGANAHAAATA